MATRRFFRIGERVFNCDCGNYDFGKVVQIDGKAEDAEIKDDSIVILTMQRSGYEREEECLGGNIYKICKSRTSRNDSEVCFEHHKEVGYPYYLPATNENYFASELN